MTKTTIKASSSSSSPTSTYLSTGALCGAASPATLYCAVLLTSALYHLTHRHSSGISIHLLSESTPTKSGRGGYRLPLCVPALPGASSHHDRGSLKYRNINLGGATLPENELLKQWEWMMLFVWLMDKAVLSVRGGARNTFSACTGTRVSNRGATQ
ncbi:hypothetical protein B0H19DRAFT_1083365 [Mycena capillaripes]|nr:hypothetical protein B0H19DRAFT_1083365 [Mycena capillaripes]